MTDLLFKIIGLVKDFTTHNREDRKARFERYLEPAIHDLQAVHRNYLDTFLQYAELIRTADPDDLSTHPVFDRMIQDAIASSDLRAQLYSFYDNTNDEVFGQFTTAIGEYFMFLGASFTNKIDDEERGAFLSSNAPRHELYFVIETAFKWSGSRDQAIRAALKRVDQSLLNLQQRYRAVLDSYNQVKKELLG